MTAKEKAIKRKLHAQERGRTNRSLTAERRAVDFPKKASTKRRAKNLFSRERTKTDTNLSHERDFSDEHFTKIKERLVRASHARDRAVASVMQRDEFLGVVSHDLRTPLTLIAMSIDRLVDMNIPGEDGKMVHQIAVQTAKAITRMDRLVSDLLDAERMSVGKLHLNKETGDLRTVVQEAVEAFSLLANTNNISLEARLPETPVIANFDSDRITQVFSNLLKNAIKVTPKNGQITIGLETESNNALITVADTGIEGISDEQKSRLFRRHEQLSLDHSGLGLGLFISKRIVESHNGKIGVESKPGGSVFWFRLPMEH